MVKNSKLEIEVFCPVGAGSSFFVWWILTGKKIPFDYYSLSLDKFNIERKQIDKTVDTSKRILYCPDNNEYMVNHPSIRACHPFHFMFNEPISYAKKQIYFEINNKIKSFCQNLFFYKQGQHLNNVKQTIFEKTNEVIGFHPNLDNLNNKKTIDMDYNLMSTVKKRLGESNSITLDYEKFFLKLDKQHMHDANFIGFDLSDYMFDVVKQYTKLNKQKLGEIISYNYAVKKG